MADIEYTQLNTGKPSDEQPEVEPEVADQYADYITNKAKLVENLNNMPVHKRRAIVKIIQFNVFKESLKAISGMKSTSEKTWKSVIRKLNAISGINVGKDPSGVDFNKFLKVFIPALGGLAGTLIALRQSEKSESEAAEPENNPNFQDNLNSETAKIENELTQAKNKVKSVILQYCDLKENGFSDAPE